MADQPKRRGEDVGTTIPADVAMSPSKKALIDFLRRKMRQRYSVEAGQPSIDPRYAVEVGDPRIAGQYQVTAGRPQMPGVLADIAGGL